MGSPIWFLKTFDFDFNQNVKPFPQQADKSSQKKEKSQIDQISANSCKANNTEIWNSLKRKAPTLFSQSAMWARINFLTQMKKSVCLLGWLALFCFVRVLSDLFCSWDVFCSIGEAYHVPQKMSSH